MSRQGDGVPKKGWWTPRGRVLKVVTRTMIVAYRRTGGAMGSDLRGLPGILLTTTGRRSQQPRVVHLPYIADGDDMIVVASFAGGPRNPAWYYNLRAHPEVRVQFRREVFAATAAEITGDELDAAWRLVIENGPWYADYRASTEREIPLIRLRRGPVGQVGP